MFSFFKTRLFLVIMLAAVVGTFYFFGDPQKLASTIIPKLKSSPLAPAVEEIENLDTKKLSEDFQKGVQNAEAEITGLSQRTNEVGEHAGNVLGSSIEPASDENVTPIHEKAFEYGKYIYCKQVVNDYQNQNPSLKN